MDSVEDKCRQDVFAKGVALTRGVLNRTEPHVLELPLEDWVVGAVDQFSQPSLKLRFITPKDGRRDEFLEGFNDQPPKREREHELCRLEGLAFLGHAKLTTTEIYTQVSIRQLKAIHMACHPSSKLKRPDDRQDDQKPPANGQHDGTGSP